VAWLWLVVMSSASTAVAADFAGPSACRACHPAQYARQSESRHARAPLLTLLSAQPLRERSGVSFEYEPHPRGIAVTVRMEDRSATAVLEWAFGAGGQAYTPVGTAAGRYIEHRISWYTAAQGARRTLGHPGTPSRDPETALGIVQDAKTIYRCFDCHATAVGPGPDVGSLIPGVTCERCHGAAGAHVRTGAPLVRLSGNRDRIMNLCGSCHRLPPGSNAAEPEVRDPLSIRFAPVGLMASACYRKSKDLSCVTCHDPHQDASQQASTYEPTCASCHQCGAGEATNCLHCHMQKNSPAPYLTFTDHRIRVYRKTRR
jgi:DNA-directed RNA polymerase subunit RPC12/RpoP